MISAPEFERLWVGQFVTLTLADGPTITGYAVRDIEDTQFLRVDGLALEDDGSVCEFSLRLKPSDIQSAGILSEPPTITDSRGVVHVMTPNKSPEPTAVTPSVPPSRPTSFIRRWLSFFR
jgi:hypothetical protein